MSPRPTWGLNRHRATTGHWEHHRDHRGLGRWRAGSGRDAEVNAVNLCYETHGAGRPLILLHGELGSGEEKWKEWPMSDWHKNIAAITLFVEDPGRAKAFYRKVFELQPAHEEETEVMFRLDNTLLFLTKSSEAPRMIAPAVAGEYPDHRAPTGARSPRSVNEQQRRRLPRAVVDHVHPVRVLNVVITHARDDTGLSAISLGQMSAPRSTYSHMARTSGT